ncbi:DUF1588 domain-containing protein [Peristeroidobacter soli]|uniref:DUF1588 domain-containing protein n=1 Tax=Peristeroidobacter soli TaxID=2497877 RepID=UPI00101C05B3|nr:DUF1588 domain-containing protein [Peristeroidobacter soli]
MQVGKRVGPKRKIWLLSGAVVGIAAVLGLVVHFLPSSGYSGEIRGTEPKMRLMSKEQYINTLTHIFGSNLRIDARFAPMSRKDGLLANGAAVANLDAGKLDQFRRTATLVASAVTGPEYRDFLIPCQPKDEKAADAACASQFLSSVGRLLYRRPLTDEQTNVLVQVAGVGAERLGGFYSGLAIALEGMLISPDFLFISDSYEPDPDNKGRFRYDAYSMAQRFSFLLWNAGPDDALLKAAESGEIQTRKGRERVVDMMLASPRFEVGTRAFFDDLLDFEVFDTLFKDPQIYPSITGATIVDAREQTLRTIVNHLVTQKKSYLDLYTTRETFISPALAVVYGAPAVQGWTAYEFPEDSGRAGILTHLSFLTSHAHPGRSSPTRRGKAVRELLLCQTVPNAPPNVDFSALNNPNPAHRTQRDRVKAHLENPVCAGCHKIMDPIGLTMELFDGAGVYRTSERGNPIDASGDLDGTAFKDTVGLAQALHDNPALPSCFVRRMYSYATGGPTTHDDGPYLDYLNKTFGEEGYRLPELLRTIVLSPAFSQAIPTEPAGDEISEPGKAGNLTANALQHEGSR